MPEPNIIIKLVVRPVPAFVVLRPEPRLLHFSQRINANKRQAKMSRGRFNWTAVDLYVFILHAGASRHQRILSAASTLQSCQSVDLWIRRKQLEQIGNMLLIKKAV